MQRRKEIILENLFRKFIDSIAQPDMCHVFKFKDFADWLSVNASHLNIKQINWMMHRDCVRNLGGDQYLYEKETDV
jgi:hypothetical protein